jgi:hypothetical protein
MYGFQYKCIYLIHVSISYVYVSVSLMGDDIFFISVAQSSWWAIYLFDICGSLSIMNGVCIRCLWSMVSFILIWCLYFIIFNKQSIYLMYVVPSLWWTVSYLMSMVQCLLLSYLMSVVKKLCCLFIWYLWKIV